MLEADASAQPSSDRSVVVLLGIVPFQSIKQRPHWLAAQLSVGYRVLYVDPTYGWRPGRPLSSSSKCVDAHLAVLSPGVGLPISGYLRVANRINARRTAAAIRTTLRSLHWPNPSIVAATFPKHLDVAAHFPSAALTYDVMDDYPAFFNTLQRWTLSRMHSRLLRQSELVTVSSDELARRVQPWRDSSVIVLRNAVPQRFAEKCAAAAIPRWLEQLPRPVFGYVGTVAPWLDFSAIENLARAFPQGTVLLVGPVEARIPALPDNVRLIPAVDHGEIPSLLRSLDMGLVPFRRSPAIDCVDPVKVYEYLAAGLAVLATPFVGITSFGAGVHVCEPAQWPQRATTILASPASRDALSASVATETWEVRGEQLRTLLTGLQLTMGGHG